MMIYDMYRVESRVSSAEQCRGCRRVPNADRKHTFEVLFAHGPPLELSASTKVDENSWLMAICNAVTNPVSVSIAASLSVTEQRVTSLIGLVFR